MSKGKVFTAQEVQAIIAGNKTMFRTVVKNKTPFPDFLQLREAGSDWYKDKTISIRNKRSAWEDFSLQRFVEKFCPYRIGQRIFVKESFNIFAGQVTYKQSLANVEKYFWKPATQMKQGQSRLTLQIKEIRVEKLQDINEEDCINEGFDYDWLEGKGNILIAGSITNNFAKNWNATHKKPEEKFMANPWVWVIDFEVVK